MKVTAVIVPAGPVPTLKDEPIAFFQYSDQARKWARNNYPYSWVLLEGSIKWRLKRKKAK